MTKHVARELLLTLRYTFERVIATIIALCIARWVIGL